MAQENKTNMSGGFGGLMRFSEEYASRINLKPMHVIILIILIILFRISLSFFFSK
jgi:preprotein translocase subunit Sec61beta